MIGSGPASPYTHVPSTPVCVFNKTQVSKVLSSQADKNHSHQEVGCKTPRLPWGHPSFLLSLSLCVCRPLSAHSVWRSVHLGSAQVSQVTPPPPGPCTVSPAARFQGDCARRRVWSRGRQDQPLISSAQGCPLCRHPAPDEPAAQPPCCWARVDVPSREMWVKASLSPSMVTTVSCVPEFTVTRSK